MKAYLQYADGYNETECLVTEPDPADGSYIVQLPEGTKPDLSDPDQFWFRIIP